MLTSACAYHVEYMPTSSCAYRVGYVPTNACTYHVDKAGDAVKHPTMDRKTPAAQYSAQRVTSTNLGKAAWIASAPWREGSQHVHSNGKLVGSH